MSTEELSSRLRQAIQGCTLHNHGPVQAWHLINEKHKAGEICKSNIARNAITSCEHRIEQLISDGVSATDPRIIKEKITQEFISDLFRV